jgi:urease accessory protein
MTTSRLRLLAPLSLIPVSLAMAHPGHSPSAGAIEGFAHPLGGLDHVVAMVAIGLWAAQLGGRARWLVPVTFVAAMSAAALTSGLIPVWVDVDQGIAASVVAVGILLARAERLPLSAGVVLTALFAVSHGVAHGREMPANASGLLFGLGFVAATLALTSAGLGLGLVASQTSRRTVQLAGWGVAAAGAMLLAF